ncbi:hypothetical protein ACFFX0_20285 [Citricoccus parietis]|uniref:Uncharacterized protein n=1 Tax=Citricoccus parietis TaxID=592307 RepID=A0ABV5G3A6_9MICC
MDPLVSRGRSTPLPRPVGTGAGEGCRGGPLTAFPRAWSGVIGWWPCRFPRDVW